MSYHGTRVVVIEIPEGTPRPAAEDSLNLQTANLSTRRYPQLALTSAAPGSAQALHLVVSDIVGARQQLVAQGIDASEVFHCASGTGCRFPGIDVRVSGPHPATLSYGSFVSFKDPDGNGWLLQEVTERLPGRV